MDVSLIEQRKVRARSWFEALRNDICAAFEKLEDEDSGRIYFTGSICTGSPCRRCASAARTS